MTPPIRRRAVLTASALVLCGLAGCTEQSDPTDGDDQPEDCEVEPREHRGEATPIEATVSATEYDYPCATGSAEAARAAVERQLPEVSGLSPAATDLDGEPKAVLKIVVPGDCRRSDDFEEVVSVTPSTVDLTVETGEGEENEQCRTEIHVAEEIAFDD